MGQEGSFDQDVQVSRRRVLKDALKTAVAVGLVSRETSVEKEGVQTQNGVFYPLYERHSMGVKKEDLPHHLDGFFYELAMGDGKIFTDDPSSLLYGITHYNGPEVLRNKEVLNILLQSNVRIMFGDINLPEGVDGKSFGSLIVSSAKKTLGVGMIAGGLNVPNDTQEEKPPGKTSQMNFINKRQFIKQALIGTGLLLTVPHIVQGLWRFDPEAPLAKRRIFARLQGFLSHTMPEDHITFFRNLVMADKLLTVAEELKHSLGRKPNIAFNVGALHGGIEDFLKAGHTFTRWLIAQYPKSILQDTIRANGGLDNFCAVRMLDIPPNVRAELIDSFQGEKVNWIQLEKIDQAIHSVTIRDESLLKTLQKEFEQEKQEKNRMNEEKEKVIKPLVERISSLK